MPFLSVQRPIRRMFSIKHVVINVGIRKRQDHGDESGTSVQLLKDQRSKKKGGF